MGLGHSYNPMYRAEQDVSQLAKLMDFAKVTMYHNVAGERLVKYIDNLGASMLADLPKQQLLEFTYRTSGFNESSTYEQLHATGLSADYVYREAKRSVENATIPSLRIYAGIDAGLPTDPKSLKTPAESTKEGVLAALRGGAHGIILSRKYSEMNLANLSAAGAAVKESVD